MTTDVRVTVSNLVSEHGSLLAAIEAQTRAIAAGQRVLAALHEMADGRAFPNVSIRDLAVKHGYRPYAVVECLTEGGARLEVELMSWPYQDHGKVLIKARTIPGDPATLESLDVFLLGDVLRTT